MGDFAGKVVIVTGSSSGIGAETALSFARQGAKLTITGRNAEALTKVADQIKEITDEQPLAIVGNLSDNEMPDKLIQETLLRYQKIDILVNNAGSGGGNKDSLSNPQLMDVYDELFHLNVRTVLKLTQLAMEHLEKTKGNIVNVSSIVSHAPFNPIYGATKAALDYLTKVNAKELAPKGIRVNSVNPGPVATGFMRTRGFTDPEVIRGIYDTIGEATPLKIVGESSDIANVILFLANNKLARNITGSIIVSDSGTLLDVGCLRNINLNQK